MTNARLVDILYPIAIILQVGLVMFGLLSIAERAIARQDLINQEQGY